MTAGAAGGKSLVDCLRRAEILLPRTPIRGLRCIAAVVSPGFEELLDDMLGSLHANSGCQEDLVVVFAAGRSRKIDLLAAKHRVRLVRCRPRSDLNPMTNSTLYSVARVIDAEKFLCLDADMLILGSLNPIFAALDACAEGSIFACSEGNETQFRDLAQALRRIYGGRRSDIGRLLGADRGEGRYGLVFNSGLWAGGRTALLALDACIRRMRDAAAWIDENPEITWRSQFVFNLALAHLQCGVELSPVYNLQLHVQSAETACENGRFHARWKGQEVRVLHFNGSGRSSYPQYRGLFAQGRPACLHS